MDCLLKRLPDIWKILGRARKKNDSLQLFVFGQNAFETARANATIRKDSGFAMDFAPHDIKIDPEVAELAQFWFSNLIFWCQREII